MKKSRKKFRTKITKKLISGIVHARAWLKFLWVTKDPLGSSGKNLAHLARTRSAHKIPIISCSSLFLAILGSLDTPTIYSQLGQHPLYQLRKFQSFSWKNVLVKKYFCQVVQFGTNIALYVKCSKMRLYVSLRSHFIQL